MNTYCLSCKKDMRNIDPKVVKTKNDKNILLSRCSICNNKKSTFTVELSSLERSSSECISQGSGIFDSLVYNTNRDRMKDALWNAFN